MVVLVAITPSMPFLFSVAAIKPDLVFVQIGRDLHEDRHAAAMLALQFRLALLQRAEQRVERFVALQGAQVLGISWRC